MESPDCANQRSDADFMKKTSGSGSAEEDDPTRNGQDGEEDSKKTNKRKASFSDNDDGPGGKLVNMKSDDHVRGEIPAHHARRPPNGFLLFCKRHRDIVSAKNPNLENRGVTKLLGNWWRTLEEDERDKYKELARQNKEIFIANNPQFTWYKLPAPPLRTLVTRPSNRRPPKLEPNVMTSTGPITPGKLADESQLGGLTSLLSSSLSPPTTPLNTSPPLPAAPAPPKKRFLLQTRTKDSVEEPRSPVESDDGHRKKPFKTARKKHKKPNSNNPLKYKRNLKLKWNESISGKILDETDRDGRDPWNKSENGCTQQQLIEKIVDSSFDGQKPFQDSDVQRALDYINTEHTYQKNPGRFWQQQKQIHQQQQHQQQQQQQQKCEKRDECLSIQIVGKGDVSDGSLISPNLNNNTIVLSESGQGIKNGLNYSFNNNNNLIVDYVDSNQRKLDQSSIQTNHDRIRTSKIEDGYIPGGRRGCVKETREDCDNSKRLEDQKKPLQLAQDVVEDDDCSGYAYEEDEEEDEDGVEEEEEEDDEEEDELDDEDSTDRIEIPKNCDRGNADFQSILGKVSREIVSMMKDRDGDAQDADEMAVARFNVRSKSETDSDGSWYDRSDNDSPPESPGGRRSKRSCKGQRYEQFIKDSVSKKRGKTPNAYGSDDRKRHDSRNRRRKSERSETVDVPESDAAAPDDLSKFLSKEKECSDVGGRAPEDLTKMKQGTKPSDIIQLKLDLESKLKRQTEDKNGGRVRDGKANAKKKPISKVQMIKEKREMHVGEFNLNEKIEALPLLSFESFLQKKRQRKKKLLGMKKDGLKSKVIRNRLEKLRGKSPVVPEPASLVPGKPVGHAASKPDFADPTTLGEIALTLLSLREPR